MEYMLTSSEEHIAAEWEKYKGYTIRPLDSTVTYYKKIISEYSKKDNFLLYGGTPEIRNIFHDFNLSLTLIDRSEKIVKAMGRLTHDNLPINKNETFVKSEWLNLKVKHNYYDLLIGDDAINMVSWNNFDLFLNQASNILNKNGIFICHLLVKPDENLINKPFLEVLSEYIDGKIKSKFDLASRLNFICYDKNELSMGWQQTIQILGKQQLQLLKKYFDFEGIFKLCNSKFYCPSQLDFEKKLTNYFKIEEIFYPHEYEYCLFEPVYVLSKLH